MRPLAAVALVVAVLAFAPLASATEEPTPRPRPWAELGLSDRQAAVVLLNRFTFGPRPGEVDEVVATGIWEWFDAQLNPGPDPVLDRLLAAIPVDGLDGHEIGRIYRSNGQLQIEAVRAGVLDSAGGGDPDAVRKTLETFAASHRLRRWSDLLDELATHSLTRMAHGRSQLCEVMTEFWLDHLCASTVDPDVTPWILDYRMEAIRPHALGSFRELLQASAHHPAMLLYLDGAESTAAPGALTASRLAGGGDRGSEAAPPPTPETGASASGPNENYARELLELHTLGVDGGYTERDVAEVARAFTGWTIAGPRASEYRDDPLAAGRSVFRPDRHDAGPKSVLGHALAPGRGLEDGEDVLDLLALHPSTARHVCRRLAVRFVSDEPPRVLVEDLATVWRRTGGDLRSVLVAMATHPAMWREVLRESKIKTPLELQVSALRALDARIEDGRALRRWLRSLGQPLDAAPSPAGWGSTAADWLDSGGVIARQRFALSLALGAVPGTHFEIPADPAAGPWSQAQLDATFEHWRTRILPERPRRPLADMVRAAGPSLSWHGFSAEDRQRRVIALLLASPEFQRR